MDKQKIELFQHNLFAEFTIGAVLYKNKSQQDIIQIKTQFKDNRYSDTFINSILRKLVSYGIITACLIERKKILFQITDFGNYFFAKLLSENNNIKEFINCIGDN